MGYSGLAHQSARHDWIFYDGTCGLCHRSVKFVLPRDRDSRFHFAPLHGQTFNEYFDDAAKQILPDSIVVLTCSGKVLVRSDATAYVLRRIGGAWAPASRFLELIPRAIRDTGYDFIAKVRRKLFEKPETSCPILPPEFASRFHP